MRSTRCGPEAGRTVRCAALVEAIAVNVCSFGHGGRTPCCAHRARYPIPWWNLAFNFVGRKTGSCQPGITSWQCNTLGMLPAQRVSWRLDSGLFSVRFCIVRSTRCKNGLTRHSDHWIPGAPRALLTRQREYHITAAKTLMRLSVLANTSS